MMCNLVIDEEKFDRIMGNVINYASLDDLGETGIRAFGLPSTNRQVLVLLAVTVRSYGSELWYHDRAI